MPGRRGNRSSQGIDRDTGLTGHDECYVNETDLHTFDKPRPHTRRGLLRPGEMDSLEDAIRLYLAGPLDHSRLRLHPPRARASGNYHRAGVRAAGLRLHRVGWLLRGDRGPAPHRFVRRRDHRFPGGRLGRRRADRLTTAAPAVGGNADGARPGLPGRWRAAADAAQPRASARRSSAHGDHASVGRRSAHRGRRLPRPACHHGGSRRRRGRSPRQIQMVRCRCRDRARARCTHRDWDQQEPRPCRAG